MADMKIPAGGLPVARTAQTARTEEVRAAQRAFFEAALANAPAPAAIKAAQPAAGQAAQAAAQPGPELTSRYPRPGSRVDIKV